MSFRASRPCPRLFHPLQYDFTVALFHIDDVSDVRLAAFRSVPDPELLRLHGLFAAEGRLVVKRLLAGRLTTCAVMVTPAALTALAELIPTGASRSMSCRSR